MKALLTEIRNNPLRWLLAFVPVVCAAATNTGRSAWFVGVLVLMVYLIFAMTLYLLPPRGQSVTTPDTVAAEGWKPAKEQMTW